MYNDYDDMYGVSDIDEDIKLRKELIEKAKAVDVDGDLKEVNRQFTDMRKQWKRIQYGESAYEDELMEEFEDILNVFYQKRREGYGSNQEMKEALIEKAKQLVASENLKKATQTIRELMDEWKIVGSCGKEKDDELWESFNAARQAFFDRKHQYWEELQVKFENARKVKQEIIETAATIAGSEEWAKTSDVFKELMTKWKEVGSAGKEHEDELWNAFNKHRQNFYERREVHYGQMRDEQDQKYEQKKTLVEQAKAISTSREYTRENTATMKDLNIAWKTIGNCGKDREDAIWQEFKNIMDIYFAGLQEDNNLKQAQWRQNLIDSRTRKQELIAAQKRQIKWLEQEMVGLLGQRAIDDAQEQIEDKKAFIIELEEQIVELDKKITE